jgi:hypothetical protein
MGSGFSYSTIGMCHSNYNNNEKQDIIPYPHPSSDGAKSTNESRQPISKSLLLIRLEFCQQALMSLRETLHQTRCCLVPFITQMKSEHTSIMKITHSPHPSPLLKMLDEGLLAVRSLQALGPSEDGLKRPPIRLRVCR